MNEAIQKLVEAVQKASPVVWNAAYRQVYINGIENVLLFFAFLFAGKALWKFSKKLADDNSDEVGVFFGRLGAIGLFALCIPCVLEFLDCFLNPTFAAIKQLKGLL